MSRLKEYQPSDLKYISEERKKEVEEVFSILGLINQTNQPNYFHPPEDYSVPFKQFSILKNKKIIFSSSS